MRNAVPIQRKGQSTVEYIVLVTAVLTVVIFFLISKNAPYQARLNATYNTAVDGVASTTQRLFCAIDNSAP